MVGNDTGASSPAKAPSQTENKKTLGGKREAGSLNPAQQAVRDRNLAAIKNIWQVGELANAFPAAIKPGEMGTSAISNIRVIATKVPNLQAAQQLFLNECKDSKGQPVPVSFAHTDKIAKFLKGANPSTPTPTVAAEVPKLAGHISAPEAKKKTTQNVPKSAGNAGLIVPRTDLVAPFKIGSKPAVQRKSDLGNMSMMTKVDKTPNPLGLSAENLKSMQRDNSPSGFLQDSGADKQSPGNSRSDQSPPGGQKKTPNSNKKRLLPAKKLSFDDLQVIPPFKKAKKNEQENIAPSPRIVQGKSEKPKVDRQINVQYKNSSIGPQHASAAPTPAKSALGGTPVQPSFSSPIHFDSPSGNSMEQLHKIMAHNKRENDKLFAATSSKPNLKKLDDKDVDEDTIVVEVPCKSPDQSKSKDVQSKSPETVPQKLQAPRVTRPVAQSAAPTSTSTKIPSKPENRKATDKIQRSSNMSKLQQSTAGGNSPSESVQSDSPDLLQTIRAHRPTRPVTQSAATTHGTSTKIATKSDSQMDADKVQRSSALSNLQQSAAAGKSQEFRSNSEKTLQDSVTAQHRRVSFAAPSATLSSVLDSPPKLQASARFTPPGFPAAHPHRNKVMHWAAHQVPNSIRNLVNADVLRHMDGPNQLHVARELRQAFESAADRLRTDICWIFAKADMDVQIIDDDASQEKH